MVANLDPEAATENDSGTVKPRWFVPDSSDFPVRTLKIVDTKNVP